jgi:hypothetical protein
MIAFLMGRGKKSRSGIPGLSDLKRMSHSKIIIGSETTRNEENKENFFAVV